MDSIFLSIKNNSIFLTTFTIAVIFLAFVGLTSIKPKKNKEIIVLLISMFLIAWLDFYSYILLTIYSLIIWLVVRSKISVKNSIAIFVLLNILLLIFIKDYWRLFEIENPYIPLGVSYYFFRLIAFVIEYSRNPDSYKKISLFEYLFYVYFFPIFLSGPIQRFQQFVALNNEEKNNLGYKVFLILVISVAVKVAIVDGILYSLVYENMYQQIVFLFNEKRDITNVQAHLFGIFAFLHAYLDLMLYTEISKNTSRILGYRPVENFNKPLLSSNISMFWQRWHMSLSGWTRDYVFMPILIRTKNTWISTYASMLTIGIWHSMTINWISWALFHATALNVYNYFRKFKYFQNAQNHVFGGPLLRICGNIITIYFVITVFILVATRDFTIALYTYFSLFS